MGERPSPFETTCPLCGNAVHIVMESEGQCGYCGAELKLFYDLVEANHFTEAHKAGGESVRLLQAPGKARWLVGYKSSPLDTNAGGYKSRGFELGDR